MKPSLPMTNPWYGWSPLPSRALVAWPGGARLALCVLLSLEHLEYLPPPGSLVAPSVRTGGPYPATFDPHLVSLHEYGNRVGVFRVLDVLDRLGLRATAAVDALVCARLPHLAHACLERGYELAGHGLALSRMLGEALPEAEERAYIAQSLKAVEGIVGARPAGWVGMDYGESSRTVGLLAEAGVRYVCDWPNDDQPYRMTSPAGSIVSLPVTLDADDVYTCKQRSQPARVWQRSICDSAETLRAEGGRMIVVHVHPWVSGQPFRIRALERALRHVLDLGDVWPATGAEIVEHWSTLAAEAHA